VLLTALQVEMSSRNNFGSALRMVVLSSDSVPGKWVHEENKTEPLHGSAEQLKKFMAKRNLRKGIEAVTAIKKLQAMSHATGH